MIENIGQRHRGDLEGKLEDSRLPARVTIALTEEVARTPVAQHLTWMLLNLLARQTPEIAEIELHIPDDVQPVSRLGPLVPIGNDLLSVLVAGINRVNPQLIVSAGQVEKQKIQSRVFIRVGPGPQPAATFDTFYVTTAYGWSGYVGRECVATIGQDDHPLGAYTAACLCAGEVFKFVRGMRSDAGEFANNIWLDVYKSEVLTAAPTDPGPSLTFDIQGLPAIVAGVGAVTNGFLHTLYPVATLHADFTLIDGDIEGITDHNLNRYVLFGLEHIGQLKACTAANSLTGENVTLTPVDAWWQTWRNKISDQQRNEIIPLVLSLVDNNQARHAIQDSLPRLIVGASTKEMRAQVNYYDIKHQSPCLRCRNPQESFTSDVAIIADLQGKNAEERSLLADRVRVSLSDLELYLTDPVAHCGLISGVTLQKFADIAREPSNGEWSVGFVSTLAGVLLAAEYLKLSIGTVGKVLNAQKNTFRFQFWRPEAKDTNKIYETPPQIDCQCQSVAFRRALATLTG